MKALPHDKILEAAFIDLRIFSCIKRPDGAVANWDFPVAATTHEKGDLPQHGCRFLWSFDAFVAWNSGLALESRKGNYV